MRRYRLLSTLLELKFGAESPSQATTPSMIFTAEVPSCTSSQHRPNLLFLTFVIVD